MTNENETDQGECSELAYKDYLCPFSGIGQPPTEWSACVAQCSLYDATSGYCSLQALWHLRQLPELCNRIEGVGNVLWKCS